MRLLFALCLAALAGCMTPASRAELLQTDGDGLEALIAACAAPIPEKLLERAAPDEADRKFVRRINLLETALTGRPLVAGNQVTLLLDGPITHHAQLAAIRTARHHVHLNAYIITDDKVGQQYREALIDRARKGVKVRVMFDSIGGMDAGTPFRQGLRDAGVELHEYAPVNPLKDPIEALRLRISNRDHRKILIVDGRIAFTGGVGISDEYRRSSAPSARGSEAGWRDTHVQIEGPAVAEFQRLFFEGWEKEEESIPPSPRYWPKLAPAGPDLVRAVSQHGNDLSEVLLEPLTGLTDSARDKKRKAREKGIYGSYLLAMAESRKRIWITQAYFAPNDEFLDVLKRAVKRGSDVRLLMPGNSDVGLVLHASRHYYAEMLDAGIRLFEYQGPVLHAKTAVIDSVWATVGSSNLDYRSFIHNDEANAIIIGRSFAREMEAMFLKDLESAKEIKRDEWDKRPLLDKLRERLAILAKYWI